MDPHSTYGMASVPPTPVPVRHEIELNIRGDGSATNSFLAIIDQLCIETKHAARFGVKLMSMGFLTRQKLDEIMDEKDDNARCHKIYQEAIKVNISWEKLFNALLASNNDNVIDYIQQHIFLGAVFDIPKPQQSVPPNHNHLQNHIQNQNRDQTNQNQNYHHNNLHQEFQIHHQQPQHHPTDTSSYNPETSVITTSILFPLDSYTHNQNQSQNELEPHDLDPETLHKLTQNLAEFSNCEPDPLVRSSVIHQAHSSRVFVPELFSNTPAPSPSLSPHSPVNPVGFEAVTPIKFDTSIVLEAAKTSKRKPRAKKTNASKASNGTKNSKTKGNQKSKGKSKPKTNSVVEKPKRSRKSNKIDSPATVDMKAEVKISTSPTIANETQNLQSTTTTKTTENRGKKRRKVATPEEWLRVKNKMLRMQGQAYMGYTKVKVQSSGEGQDPASGSSDGQLKNIILAVRQGRSLGPPCDAAHCLKGKSGTKCTRFSEEDREILFENFWKKMNWEQRKIYVASHVDVMPVKKSTVKGRESKRALSLIYMLKLDGEKQRVCKKMFLRTLGIGAKAVNSWVLKASDNLVPILKKEKIGVLTEDEDPDLTSDS